MYRRLTIAICAAAVLGSPDLADAQRFGGQFGGGAGVWLVYVNPGVDSDESFGRDVGDVVGLGARGFFQSGRFRLGGGFFGGGFTNDGLNAAGDEVDGGLTAGGVTAEYLVVQRNFELAVGGLAGGGTLTIEERLSTSGDIETLRRRREHFFAGYPWVRAAYNLAPFVNVGVELGYLIGTNQVGGFAAGLDIVVGLIP